MSDKTVTTTIPPFWTWHRLDGSPSGIYTLGEKPPKPETDGWLFVFHPEQEIELTVLPCIVERRHGFAQKIMEVDPSKIVEIDLSKFVKIGDRLTWKQRWKGIA